MLQFVENVDQIIENIITMEQYLASENTEDRDFAINLVKKGRAMMAYKVDGKNHFAPASFLGFRKISRASFLENEKRETRNGAPIFQSLLGKPFTHAAIEKEFADYANTFKGPTLKSKRKYWRVRNDDNKYFDLKSTAGAAEDEVTEEAVVPVAEAAAIADMIEEHEAVVPEEVPELIDDNTVVETNDLDAEVADIIDENAGEDEDGENEDDKDDEEKNA